MNENFYERKTGITAVFIHDLPMVLSMLVNSSTTLWTVFSSRDQRGGYDGIIVGLPGSNFINAAGIGLALASMQ